MTQAAIMDRSPHNPRYKRHRPEQTFLYQIVEQYYPELILLQCGADSLRGDPLAHLALTPKAHAHATERLCRLANELCSGRLMAFGGGGYNLANLAHGWSAVLEELLRGSWR